MNLRTLIIPIVLLSACTQPTKQLTHADSINIAKAIQNQTKLLKSSKPTIKRTSVLDSATVADNVCKKCLVNLVKSCGKYKDLTALVLNPMKYDIAKLDPQNPSVRNNGSKIYKGYKITVIEVIGNKTSDIGIFEFDADSKRLYWYDDDADIAHLLYDYNNNILLQTLKY